MNRHYRKRTEKLPKKMYIAYRDYTSYSSCALVYGVYDKFEDALKWIKNDVDFQSAGDQYKVSRICNYNSRSCTAVMLGNRAGAVYEVCMNKSGRKTDGNLFRYIVYQTYLNHACM